MVHVICEHPDWLVVEKPAHLLVHPTKPGGPRTLWDELKERFPGETLSLINRLDRETSGLVLVSRHAGAASILGKLTMARAIGKTYLALVSGETPPDGEIDAPLDRLGKTTPSVIYLKQAVVPGGYPALTRYRRIGVRVHGSGTKISLLEIGLATGRLHQIRVHLASIGHPVVGDKIYGPDEMHYLDFIREGWTPAMEKALWLRRHALHAFRLAFAYGGREWEAVSPLASDLQSFWDGLAPV
jgi:23S rRNA pseudouridine1911/1915/1917 synthase